MKKFIVTVDTEGDNLWAWKPGAEITTENVNYIPRFQELCEKYGLKPVYLTNYEMAMDHRWVEYGKQKAQEGKCEIGMHLHGWNTPPDYTLENRFGGNPYITEYPEDVMEEKVVTMIRLLQDRFELPILSHRSGRWATNETYFSILAKQGIKVDCSVAPQLDLSKIPGCNQNSGSNYQKACKTIHEIYPGILEIPMTTRCIHHAKYGSWKRRIKTLVFGDSMWLRPVEKSFDRLKMLTEQVEREQGEYLEFMIHSSELIPGGSTYFPTNEDIEKLYEILEGYFDYVTNLGYTGVTLQEFAYECGGANEFNQENQAFTVRKL